MSECRHYNSNHERKPVGKWVNDDKPWMNWLYKMKSNLRVGI